MGEKKGKMSLDIVTGFVIWILNMQILKSENESLISYLSLPTLHILRVIGSNKNVLKLTPNGPPHAPH